MSEKEKKRKEVATNAEWILFKEPGGSYSVKNRKDGMIYDLSPRYVKETKSLIALIEGSKISFE